MPEILKSFAAFTHLIHTAPCGRSNYYPHFKDGETKAQRGEVNCPKFESRKSGFRIWDIDCYSTLRNTVLQQDSYAILLNCRGRMPTCVL